MEKTSSFKQTKFELAAANPVLEEAVSGDQAMISDATQSMHSCESALATARAKLATAQSLLLSRQSGHSNPLFSRFGKTKTQTTARNAVGDAARILAQQAKLKFSAALVRVSNRAAILKEAMANLIRAQGTGPTVAPVRQQADFTVGTGD